MLIWLHSFSDWFLLPLCSYNFLTFSADLRSWKKKSIICKCEAMSMHQKRLMHLWMDFQIKAIIINGWQRKQIRCAVCCHETFNLERTVFIFQRFLMHPFLTYFWPICFLFAALDGSGAVGVEWPLPLSHVGSTVQREMRSVHLYEAL